jgi:hypothetical protein
MDIIVCSLVILCYVLASDSAKKYCPTHIFPFLVPTPCLTNVGKRPDNDEFSEFFFINIKSHESTGKWDHLFRNDG